jgi:hypothetical protein
MIKLIEIHIFKIILVIIINVLIILSSNINKFNSYKLEKRYLISTKAEFFYKNYQHTIINGIKNKLGSDYKIRNYKIYGPKFTIINFEIEGFKNKKKTEYVRSKTTILFGIESFNKNELYYVEKKIKKSLVETINFLFNFELFNYMAHFSKIINYECNLHNFEDHHEECLFLFNKTKIINELISNFNFGNLQHLKFYDINKHQIKKIKLEVNQLLNFIDEKKLTNDNKSFDYQKLTIILNKINLNELMNVNYKNITNLVDSQDNLKLMTIDFTNVVIVYVNLFLFLIIFSSIYIKNFILR